MPLSRHLLAALAALTLAAPRAGAEPPSAAQALYVAGEFVPAARMAIGEDASSDNLAFAARAWLAACVTRDSSGDTATMLAEAQRSAAAALAADPESVDARLQLVLAMGLRSRQMPLTDAFASGYAQRGKRLLDEAIARAPESAEAYMLLGAWHLEVIRRGGSAAALVMGARLSAGLAAFDRARALAPNNPIVALNYALALTELDASRHASRIRELLSAAAAQTPHDALAQYGAAVAERLLRVQEMEGPRALAAAVRALSL